MDSQYQLLAKRDKKTEMFTRGVKNQFLTNYFNVEINHKTTIIYQFAFKLPEEIPNDSMFYDKSIRTLKSSLKEDFGYICHKGQMFWGTKPCEIPTVRKFSFNYGGKAFDFEGLICQTRKINLEDLNQLEKKDQLLQILNIDLKNILRNAGLTELGKRGEYFPK